MKVKIKRRASERENNKVDGWVSQRYLMVIQYKYNTNTIQIWERKSLPTLNWSIAAWYRTTVKMQTKIGAKCKRTLTEWIVRKCWAKQERQWFNEREEKKREKKGRREEGQRRIVLTDVVVCEFDCRWHTTKYLEETYKNELQRSNRGDWREYEPAECRGNGASCAWPIFQRVHHAHADPVNLTWRWQN